MHRRYALAFILLLMACDRAVPRPKVAAIGAVLPREAGTVKTVSEGEVGAPIVVIEESHDSRAGQLETAIALSRLHDRFGLRDVVLEGLFKEAPEEGTPPPEIATKGSTLERAGYMARLVGEGEIGGAEFATLIYNDVALHPAETVTEYSAGLKINGQVAAILYLGQVAISSLDEESQAKAVAYAENLQAHPDESISDEKERQVLTAMKITEYFIGLDPWSKGVLAKLRDRKTAPSIEGEIALFESIIQRGDEHNTKIPDDLRQALNGYLDFLRKRSAASSTIVSSVANVADDPKVPLVAVNIGAGHTERVCALLKEAKRPFVLLSLEALHRENDGSKLAPRELARKYAREPVQGGILGKSLLEIYPIRAEAAKNKPQTVLQEDWFKAKAELYASTAGLLTALGGGYGSGPPNTPNVGRTTTPPEDDGWSHIGWGADDPRRKNLESNRHIYINPDSIEVRREKGKEEVLFEAVLTNSSGHRKSVWVKAGRVEHLNSDRDSPKTVEDVLKRELEEVKKEIDPDDGKHDENEGISRIQISLDTKAVFAATREDAVKTQIRY
jgi:hypothetical protein